MDQWMILWLTDERHKQEDRIHDDENIAVADIPFS